MTRAMHRVLIVEDEPEIRAIVRVLLEGEGYRVAEAENAERALIAARTEKPDLVLLDLGLPDGDGLQVVRGIRAWSPMPIVVLSARTLEEQKILALDAGADDYVTKPFSAPELLARARAALRRNAQAAELTAVVHIGSCRLDLPRRTAEGRHRTAPPRPRTAQREGGSTRPARARDDQMRTREASPPQAARAASPHPRPISRATTQSAAE